MLIDKFISGLNADAFEKFCQTQVLTVERMLDIANSEQVHSDVVEAKVEPSKEFERFLANEISEVTANMVGVSFQFMNASNINPQIFIEYIKRFVYFFSWWLGE